MNFAGKPGRRLLKSVILDYNFNFRTNQKIMYQLTDHEEWLCKRIVECAYNVHRNLGPGLLEKIYELCFCHELHKKGIFFKRQVLLPIEYDGLVFDEGLKLDVFVDELIICELKAVDLINPVCTA